MLSGLVEKVTENGVTKLVNRQHDLQEYAEIIWAPEQKAQHTALRKVIDHTQKAAQSVIVRGGKLKSTLNAAGEARQHANKTLKALRGERMAK
jgi:hypothetical protein